MTRRRLAVAAIVCAVFVLALIATFPTDAVVRRLISDPTGTGSPAVVFRHATVGPRGLVLEDVTLRGGDGAALFAAARIHLRPSLVSLVRGGKGLPWHIDAVACGGPAEATIAADGPATAVALDWRDANLAACPPLATEGGALAGRAATTVRLRLLPGALPEGEGSVDLTAAEWRSGPGPLLMLGTLHAETAVIRWRMEAGRLAFTTIELHGPEVSVEGGGEVRLTEPLAESAVELEVELAPAPGAPDYVRRLIGLLPGDGDDARTVAVGGTLGRPELVRRAP